MLQNLGNLSLFCRLGLKILKPTSRIFASQIFLLAANVYYYLKHTYCLHTICTFTVTCSVSSDLRRFEGKRNSPLLLPVSPINPLKIRPESQRMWLIHFDNQNNLELIQYLDAKPPYAVLSHTWGSSADEVTYNDLLTGHATTKRGYEKLSLCRDQARRDGLEHFWIDSVCINKHNAVELQEAINSMFRWYQEAAVCYVYMSDVLVSEAYNENPTPLNSTDWPPSLAEQFCQSRWFTRGWTLQELLAPSRSRFFSKEGIYLGDKSTLGPLIHRATGIQIQALQGRPLSQFSVQTRLKWAANRKTTRQEDAAYSLASLFDIYMSQRYGEGKEAAMRRLRRKIKKQHQRSWLRRIKVSAQAGSYAVSDHADSYRPTLHRRSMGVPTR